MKILGPLLLLVCGVVLGVIASQAKEPTYELQREEAPEAVPYALSGVVPAGSVVRAFEVEGICCDGCSGKLFAALDALEGVEEIAVDTVRSRVEVVASEELAVARLGEALTFDKYTARPTD